MKSKIRKDLKYFKNLNKNIKYNNENSSNFFMFNKISEVQAEIEKIYIRKKNIYLLAALYFYKYSIYENNFSNKASISIFIKNKIEEEAYFLKLLKTLNNTLTISEEYKKLNDLSKEYEDTIFFKKNSEVKMVVLESLIYYKVYLLRKSVKNL